MADALKSFVSVAEAKRAARTADLAAKAMARSCDKRIAKAKKALRLVDTFAWSCVTTDHPAATKELQRRIDAIRETLRDL